VEPFLGGGALFFNLEHHKSIVNDFNKELIDFYCLLNSENFKYLKYKLEDIDRERNSIKNFDFTTDAFNALPYSENSEIGKIFQKFINREIINKKKLIEKINSKNKTMMSGEEEQELYRTGIYAAHYYTLRHLYNNYRDEKSWWFTMRELAYSGMFRFSKKGDFNVPYGGNSYNNKTFSPKIALMESIREMDFYKSTEFCCGDFQTFFEKYNYFEENDFIFLDPPYDSEFSKYNESEDFDRDSQIRLAKHVALLKGKFMMVVKKTDFISDLYKDYKIETFDKKYSVNFHNRNNQETKHLIIRNY
jgi:DNA adenine methylase